MVPELTLIFCNVSPMKLSLLTHFQEGDLKISLKKSQYPFLKSENLHFCSSSLVSSFSLKKVRTPEYIFLYTIHFLSLTHPFINWFRRKWYPCTYFISSSNTDPPLSLHTASVGSSVNCTAEEEKRLIIPEEKDKQGSRNNEREIFSCVIKPSIYIHCIPLPLIPSTTTGRTLEHVSEVELKNSFSHSCILQLTLGSHQTQR